MIKTSLLAVFLSACVAHGENYELYISPAFDESYATHIEEAAHDWERMVPAHFNVHRAGCPGRDRTTTCIFKANAAYFETFESKGAVGTTSCAWGVDDGCRIFLLDSWPDEGQRQLAGHELGHAQGLQHEGPRTATPTTGPVIMAPNMGDGAPRPTCLDAAAWYAIRGLVVPYACADIADRVDGLD